MKIVIKNKEKIVWEKEFEFIDEKYIDIIIEEIENTISAIKNFENYKTRSEVTEEAKKQLTEGWK